MNGTHLMDIGFTAAALLGLHAGSLFMVMAAAAQNSYRAVRGIRGSSGRAPLVHGQRR